MLFGITLRQSGRMASRMSHIRKFSSTNVAMAEKVAVIGSGNWGSVAARIIGQNVKKYDQFDDTVNVWVFEEDYNGKKLTDVINTTHENPKYLPGFNLGDNVRADPDLQSATDGASILVFVTPHQFVKGVCDQLKGRIPKDAKAISLIKGMDVTPQGFQLISGVVKQELNIECSALMGANIANEIAAEKFSEATVGYKKQEDGELFVKLFDAPYFHVRSVQDVEGAELCGTLKNIVALGSGFCDGLGLGNNSKAAIIRIGLMEMRRLAREIFPTVKDETFFESCGVADLITTCYGGRNRKCAEAFVTSESKDWDKIEAELLGGQKLQGVLTSHEVQEVLKNQGIEDKFPLFTTINRIVNGQIPPEDLVRYAERP